MCIFQTLNKSQHSSLLWKIHLFFFFFLAGLIHSPCVSLQQEEAMQLIIWPVRFLRFVTQKEISNLLSCSSGAGKPTVSECTGRGCHGELGAAAGWPSVMGPSLFPSSKLSKVFPRTTESRPVPVQKSLTTPALLPCLPQLALHENISRWLIEK